MAQPVGNLAIILSGNAGPLMRTLADARGELLAFGRAGASSLSGPLALAGGGLAAIGAGFGFVQLGKSAIKAGMDYEMAATSFEVLTGSAAEGKKLLDGLSKLAVESPFSSRELIENAQKLKAVGTETDQIIPTLRALGDLSMGDAEKLGRLTKAFTDVKNNGRATAEELNQFAETGIPLIKGLADVMRVPEEAVRGLASEGQVSFPVVVAAINKMTGAGGSFAGMMDRMSETTQGQLNALTENLEVASRNAGLAFMRGFGLKDLLKEWSDTTQGMGTAVERMEPHFAKARQVFDVARDGAAALADVAGGRLTLALKDVSGVKLEWADMMKGGDLFVENLLEGFSALIELIGKAGQTLSAKFLQPLSKTLTALSEAGGADAGGKAWLKAWAAEMSVTPLGGPLWNLGRHGTFFQPETTAALKGTLAQSMAPAELKAFREMAGTFGGASGELAKMLDGNDYLSGFGKEAVNNYRQNRERRAAAERAAVENKGFFNQVGTRVQAGWVI